MNSKDWVTVIKFRISGQVGFLIVHYKQGASLFGDGFAVFFTNHATFIPVVNQLGYYRIGKDVGSDRYVPWFCCWFFYFQKHRGRLLSLNSLKISRYHRDIDLYVGDGENSAFIQDKDNTVS